ncbi:FxSxx-COOH system tetratricopeptide repeat protein [Lentzea sp.]|uniref:FxSxx-COOH system tetratricopeptide repeat protein n=1 Tax=Lentzea sp. TaxID=56099 RepID=UPI002ED2059C
MSVLATYGLDGEDTMTPRSGVPVHTTVLSGLGGVGKTQLAVAYAERVWAAGEVEFLVWVTAESREAIVSSYARANARLAGAEESDPERGARSLLEWLSTTTVPWLIVLDDLLAPRDIAGLWPPTTGTGRAVVTTRRRDAALRGHRRALVEIGVFSADEAQAYLRDALDSKEEMLDGVAALAGDLGYLPLALAQAGAYMADRHLSCAAYRARLAERRLVNLLPGPDELPDEHRATVAATWALSVEQADRLAPAGVACPLLEVASSLHANGVPVGVFTAPDVLALLTAATGRKIDEHDALDGLGCLHRLNLITFDAGTSPQTVRIHALVQRATRDTWSPERAAAVTRVTATALLQIWPDVEHDASLGQLLRANTSALDAAGSEHLWELDAHEVLFRSARSLGEAGLVAEAREQFGKLRGRADQRLGSDHPVTLSSRHASAYWRGEAGDPAGAVAALDDLLTDQLRVLGPDHPDTLTTRHDRVRWQGEAGDPAGAVAAFEEVLVDRLRVLGADHPDTLNTRHALAYSRGVDGDPNAAAAAFEELLSDRLRTLGPGHPDTLLTRNNFAYWRGKAGDSAGAVAEFSELLADYLRVLGPDHPLTLNTRHNCARWQAEGGDSAGAVAAFTELLADYLRVLGPDHPQTLNTRYHHARCRGKAGDPAGAVTMFTELLEDQLRVLGPEHPHTSNTRRKIAQWQRMCENTSD